MVHPGDLIFGDNDGVVVVSKEKAKDILAIAQAREKKEEDLLKKILRCETATFDMFKDNYYKLNLSEE